MSNELLTSHASELLHGLGVNVSGDLSDTPKRFVNALRELLEGYEEDPKEHLTATFDVGSPGLVAIRDLPFASLCEHHLLPFTGTCDIVYLPRRKVVGLSKFARLLRGYSRRLQVQERLTNQIADAIMECVEVDGVMVRMCAQHSCMALRGAESPGLTVTLATRGEFQTTAWQQWLLESK